MEFWPAVAILAAGAVAGAVNAAVGSGTLITFPTLLALGYPPVIANISNNVGLVPGSVAGAWGYRGEVRALARVVVPLLFCSATGGALGAVALLTLPSSAFDAIVPVLIVLSIVLVVAQPYLARRVAARPGSSAAEAAGTTVRPLGVGLMLGVLIAGVYGGYFGAAQGVLLIGLLGWLLTSSLQHANGVKNVLSAVVNGVAALVFVIAAPGQLDFAVAGLIAVGSTVGGVVGAALSRRLPAPLLRGFIVIVGCAAVVKLLVT
ncbi:sulfite exporter TauE/SafE family protein [Spongisporangium articulatum]|uniref:Probable membrane transporter protein n=1 Tax=Spongisporangium articulatum TaxID=3362603 RepID=A0ABW8AR64_9ACTN